MIEYVSNYTYYLPEEMGPDTSKTAKRQRKNKPFSIGSHGPLESLGQDFDRN